MKKLLALLLALAMLMCLAACGESEKPKDDATTTTTTTTTEATTTTTTKPQEDEFVFEEVTVLDDDNCVIRITEIDEDNDWGYTLKAYFENKSADVDYTISVDGATINGVCAEPLFAVDVAAGKKAKDEISFTEPFPEGVDVGEYTDIALTFSVCDSEDWEADAIAQVTTHVYPLGKDKATVYTREAQESDQVLVDNDLFTMIAIGTEEDELWGYTTDVYFVSKTDKDLLLSVDEASLNDFVVEPFYATLLTAGNCAFGEIAWLDGSLEENDFDTVESIEFTLSAMDNDDWLGDALAEEKVTFTP